MSRFTEFTSVAIPTNSSHLFILTADLVYERYFEGSGIFIIVPKGTATDFASIPWILQIVAKPHDYRWILWAIIHDCLWSQAITIKDYQEANDIFFESIQVTGTPYSLAACAYLSVSASKYPYLFVKKLKKI